MMPHIIVEFAEQLANTIEMNTVLQTIHQAVADSGLFETSHIKTRAYPFKDFTNAGAHDPYIHIQARIKSGRNAENKKQLSTVILTGLTKLNIPASVITVEIIDMDRDAYAKHTP